MWMCDFCQAINEAEADACPKCGRVRHSTPVRSAQPAAPTFGRSLSTAEFQSTSTQAPSTEPEPVLPPQQPFGYAAPPPSTAPPYSPPPYSAPPPSTATLANGAAVAAGVAVIIGALLLRLLNPVRLLFVAIGIGCILGGSYLSRRASDFESRAVKTSGSVVRLSESESGSDTTYYPVVDFTAANGQRVEVKSAVGSRPPSNHVGDEVTVYYNPADPNDAEVKTGASSIGPIFLIGFGVLFVILALAGRVQPG